jgi:GDP-fucose protein O-fucosyltransferase
MLSVVSAESFVARFRAKEVVLILLIGSVLLNVMLSTRLHILEGNFVELMKGDESALTNGGKSLGLAKFTKISAGTQAKKEEALNPSSERKDSLLQCSLFGGPSDEAAAEMSYWRDDLPPKKEFRSIYDGEGKYFVYEPDEAGFSNVRMGFETVVALTKATGRTLVLTPTMRFAQLEHQHQEGIRSYAYTDFFDVSNIPVISMEEYLNGVAMNGQLRNAKGEVTFPPYNRTNWDGRLGNTGNPGIGEATLFFKWLSESMLAINWKRDACVIPFPSENDSKRLHSMHTAVTKILKDDKGNDGRNARIQSYSGNPIPVNSSMADRLREMLADRVKLCEYDTKHQEAPSIYMTGHENTGSRPLIQFFAYLFFESWEQDLQMKRFIRDHLRFSDIIQCAAARIIEGIRAIARKVGDGNNDRGGFDTMHVRREDFKGLDVYKDGIVQPHQMIDAKFFESQRTVYIATDEKDKSFFEPLHKHHTILFLHDFDHLIKGMDPNYYGMIEQLVCAKGDKFVGTYYSTFTGYINRVRGYHAQKTGTSEARRGYLNSEYMGHNGYYRKATHVSPKELVIHFLKFIST